jgi:hypothetical protein
MIMDGTRNTTWSESEVIQTINSEECEDEEDMSRGCWAWLVIKMN